MGYRAWTPGEMFELLQYPEVSVELLSERLGRTENSVRSKIQELNVSDDYNKESLEENSLRMFCSDCVYEPKNCKMNARKCLESQGAELYRKFYNIIVDDENRNKKIKIQKKKKIKQNRLIL